jgi:threonine/homoserine/homoserine lactone efflux protein
LAIFLFVAGFAGIGLVTSKDSSIKSSLIIAGVFFGALLWWALLTFFVDLFRKKFRLKQLWWINKIAGILIIVFGVVAMLSVFF